MLSYKNSRAVGQVVLVTKGAEKKGRGRQPSKTRETFNCLCLAALEKMTGGPSKCFRDTKILVIAIAKCQRARILPKSALFNLFRNVMNYSHL